LSEAVELLDAILQEEKATDENLTVLAESEINIEADEADEGDDEEEKPKRKAGGRR
jgi:ferritin-like metal-binding protein YciE